jgi:uncharacterized protein
MKISGRHLLAVNESVVRMALADPYALRLIIPGCESVEPVGSDEYRVWINLRVGMTVDRFSGILKFRTPPGGRDLEFFADGESPNGLVHCKGQITLDTGDDGETAVCYEAEIDVGGRIATVAPRLLETTARAFARRCLEGLDKQVSRQTRIYTTSLSPAQPTSTSVQPATPLRRKLFLLFFPLAIIFILRIVSRRQARENTQPLAHEFQFQTRPQN